MQYDSAVVCGMALPLNSSLQPSCIDAAEALRLCLKVISPSLRAKSVFFCAKLIVALEQFGLKQGLPTCNDSREMKSN